jgi:hypothetical protein
MVDGSACPERAVCASRRVPALLLIAILSTILLTTFACAAHIFVPPAGPGVPAPDAASAWAEATRACRDVRNSTANLSVALRAGRGRSSSLAVSVVATSAGGIRLDGGPVFLLAGTAARAQLLLRQDNRLVIARADEIVDALINVDVKLGPERLLAVLTGCIARSLASVDAARFGPQIAVRTSDSRVFLERRDGRWRAVAGDADGIIIDYRRFNGDWPAQWRAASAASGPSAPMLEVTVTDFVINDTSIDGSQEAFQLKVPAGATQMSLEQLRAAAPLRSRK